MTGLRNLSAPHAKPPASLPEGKCSLILCPPHAFSPRTAPILISTGGMGACPHVSPSPLILPFSPAGAANSLERGYGGKAPPRFGRRAAFPSRLPEFLAFAKMRPANLVFAHSYYNTIIGKFESFFLFYIYGYSPRLQNSHTAFSLLRRPYRTRMTEQQNLPAPHAKPEIGQSGSKCSHRSRRPGQIYTNKSAGYGAEPHVNQRP